MRANPLLERLRYHVTGAIERGEAVAIEAHDAHDDCECGHMRGEHARSDGQCGDCYCEGFVRPRAL